MTIPINYAICAGHRAIVDNCLFHALDTKCAVTDRIRGLGLVDLFFRRHKEGHWRALTGGSTVLPVPTGGC